MVRHNGQWGTVCDDSFGAVEAQSACRTPGFSDGSYASGNYGFGSSVTIWMDEVDCPSSTTNFLTCSHDGWGEDDCSHSEDVFLTCT